MPLTLSSNALVSLHSSRMVSALQIRCYRVIVGSRGTELLYFSVASANGTTTVAMAVVQEMKVLPLSVVLPPTSNRRLFCT